MEVEDEATAEFPRLAGAPSFERTGGASGRSGTGVRVVPLPPGKRLWQQWSRVPGWPRAASLLGLISLIAANGSATSAQTVGSYYTDAQAVAGQTVFASQCAICHGDSMEGKVGPALAGEQFLSVSQFQELTAGFLYRTMSKQMPKNAPGSLSKTEYLDVLAYILKVNGYPAGPKQLTADNSELNKIKIVPTGKLSEHSETEDRQ
jgi:mono/diheme cytochrome c family protein